MEEVSWDVRVEFGLSLQSNWPRGLERALEICKKYGEDLFDDTEVNPAVNAIRIFLEQCKGKLSGGHGRSEV